MLLQQIVSSFDKELERLETLRAIVEGLATPAAIEELPQQLDVLVAESALAAEGAETAGKPAEMKRRGRPTGLRQRISASKPKKRLVDHGALTSSIPAGPVVISPATLLARKAEQLVHHKPEPVRTAEKGTLGAMMRALHLELPQS